MTDTGNSIEERSAQSSVVEEKDLELMHKKYQREINRFQPRGVESEI